MKPPPPRTRLDNLRPKRGTVWTVYFPHGRRPRTMFADGVSRDANASTHSQDFQMRGIGAALPEWVPGWYIASRKETT